jgi:DNA replicative helicase MCM subunit Mcm2 (Cdc46/Mcm family)
MERIPFTCQKCEKTIQVDLRIYHKAYKDYKHCLSCRNKAISEARKWREQQ